MFLVNCAVYKFSVLIVGNCTHEELKRYLKRSYRLELNDHDSDSIGTMFTFDKNPWRLIWVKDWKDKACLVHEIFHLVTRVCYDRGIRIVSHDGQGNVSDEPAAYLMEFLYAQCIKRK